MKIIVCSALLCVFAVTPAVADMVLLSDNFNSEHGGTGVLNYNGFANWNVSDGTVDVIGNNYYDFLPGNGLYVDMDGSTNNAGKMTTKTSFSFEPGYTYTLSFELAGNHRNNSSETVKVQVGLGTIFNNSYSLSQTAPFTLFTETFTVPSTTTAQLSFEGIGGDNIGMLLDDVTLSAVPVPAAVLLGLLGLGAAGLKLRKFA
jgi:hypothetical protein